MSKEVKEVSTDPKGRSKEDKMLSNPTIVKIIEIVYMKEVFDKVVENKMLVEECNPEEYLKLSQMLRDDTENFHSHIVLQFCKTILKYQVYTNFVLHNLFYYLYMWRGTSFVCNTEMIDALKNPEIENSVIVEALIQLIEDNTLLN